ncbi:hypothetical protein LTR78_006769 [Recurvomyces mirabilis]|uniref:Xylanolytic transcriptional activator regulatory domain-containing protein n=1 Tax=Recurvomyces mirabilis TaxID=574656 RepID=A0AAE1BZE4_9PEZI|nr:hypothetical protein LTR78_006769 [Recurvomyces mirabilis]KAK5153242.1 hypothetical protein LTS14_007887 [Recurvomyces mirabilis]
MRQSTQSGWYAAIAPIFPSLRGNGLEEEDGASDVSGTIVQRLSALLLKATGPSIDPSLGPQEIDVVTALNAVLSNLGSIMLDKSLSSVRLLVLSGLLLRACGQTEIAWQLACLALPIAQSCCLHRRAYATIQGEPTAANIDQMRLWWSLYTLDKMLCLELERASSIRDLDCNQESPPHAGAYLDDIHLAAIELAKIQSQVSERLMQSRAQEESDDVVLEAAIINKMRAVGELDGLLTAWAERRPPELRPSEYSYCDAESLPSVAHLALQYHQTLFLLHRHALMLNMHTVQAEVARHFPNEPYRHRLRNVLNSSHGPLLAAYGLAIQIVRHPTASAARSDLELQATAIAILKEHQKRYALQGMADVEEDEMTSQLLDQLHRLVRLHVDKTARNTPTGSSRSTQAPTTDWSSRAYPVSGPSSAEMPSPHDPPSTGSLASRTDAQMRLDQDLHALMNQNRQRVVPDAPAMTSWPPSTQFDSSLLGGLDGMDMDWDALAFAFDLPQ